MNVLTEFFAGADGLSTEPCAEEKKGFRIEVLGFGLRAEGSS